MPGIELRERAGLQWGRFKFAGLPGIPKAAVLLPVILQGKRYDFELDTGTFQSVIPEGLGRQLGWKPGQSSVTSELQVGPEIYQRVAFAIQAQKPAEASSTRGTIGLDLLVGKILILDFRRREFYLGASSPYWGLDLNFFSPRSATAPNGRRGKDAIREFLRRGQYQPAQIRNGKLFTSVRIDGKLHDDLFFDSGSCSFSLVVNEDLWKSLTGRRDARCVRVLRVPSWGRWLHLIGAPALGSMTIGPITTKRPMVFFCEERPSWFEPIEAAGLLGGLPFFSDTLVIDLQGSPRIGVVR